MGVAEGQSVSQTLEDIQRGCDTAFAEYGYRIAKVRLPPLAYLDAVEELRQLARMTDPATALAGKKMTLFTAQGRVEIVKDDTLPLGSVEYDAASYPAAQCWGGPT